MLMFHGAGPMHTHHCATTVRPKGYVCPQWEGVCVCVCVCERVGTPVSSPDQKWACK